MWWKQKSKIACCCGDKNLFFYFICCKIAWHCGAKHISSQNVQNTSGLDRFLNIPKCQSGVCTMDNDSGTMEQWTMTMEQWNSDQWNNGQWKSVCGGGTMGKNGMPFSCRIPLINTIICYKKTQQQPKKRKVRKNQGATCSGTRGHFPRTEICSTKQYWSSTL